MRSIQRSILFWYKKMNCQMPWRETKDPYKIWISEIMLQQTQVDTVKSYYKKWINKFPTIKKLATANRDDILKTWEGLGYYQRAHNIYETAQVIMDKHNGNIPQDYNNLLKLKGIGDYTACAILSIAFNQKYPAIDGNIKRIISRYKKVKNNKELYNIAKLTLSKFMTSNNSGNLNQALMDLGREICTPQKPSCNACPIKQTCLAYKTQQTDSFPIVKRAKKKPTYDVIVGLIWNNNKMLISKRKEKGLLGGLWELPGGKKKTRETNINCLKREILEELNIKISVGEKIGKIKHHYSHFGINLVAYNCYYKEGEIKPLQSDQITWIRHKEISKFAFPSATHKIFKLYNIHA